MQPWNWTALRASASLIPLAMPAFAQGVQGHLVSTELLRHDSDCSVLALVFQQPVQYTSHFPLENGNQLSVRLHPLQNGDIFLGHQTVAVPDDATGDITGIEYDGSTAGGPTLNITFARPVYFQLAPSADFMRLILSVSDQAHRGSCLPQKANANPSPTQSLAAGTPNLHDTNNVRPPSAGAQQLFDEAKASLLAKDYPKAVRLLTKFLEGADNSLSPDALELLGVAHERADQEALAKAQYEEYLRRFPNSPGAGRVRQRLQALLYHAQHPKASYTPGAEPPSVRWDANATVSEFFYHDEMSLLVKDSGAQVTIDQGLTSLQTLLVSGIDATLTATGEDYRARVRTSASYSRDFIDSSNSRARVSESYLELSDIDKIVTGRVGRQYRSDDGILGRFDGGSLAFRFGKNFKVDVNGGFPVDMSYSNLDTNRYLVSAGVGYEDGAVTANVYGLRQSDHGLLDRESVGFDVRYVAPLMSVYSTFDYDLNFNKINVAQVNGNLTLQDQTSFNLSLDYRAAPLLRLSNALIGQPVTALDKLILTYTTAEIEQLARDRTATSLSVYGSVSRPISEMFSVGVDATLWKVTGTPESGGVPAVPGTGNQYYFSGHVTGTNMFADGDLATLTGGYSKMFGSDRYTIDLNTRYPVMRNLRIGPRIFASYRNISVSGATAQIGSQTVLRPTLRLYYRPTQVLELDVEGGTEWQNDKLGTTTTNMQNYLVSVGLIYSF